MHLLECYCRQRPELRAISHALPQFCFPLRVMLFAILGENCNYSCLKPFQFVKAVTVT
jgi:hypothetical protein